MKNSSMLNRVAAHRYIPALCLVGIAWIVWLVICTTVYVQASVEPLILPLASGEYPSLTTYLNLSIASWMLLLSIIVLLGSLSIRDPATPAMLLYFIASTSLVIFALLFPPSLSPDSAIPIAVLQLLQTVGIAGMCTLPTQPSSAADKTSVAGIMIILTSCTVAILISEGFYYRFSPYIYFFVAAISLSCFFVSIIAYQQSSLSIHRHSALIALLHLAVTAGLEHTIRQADNFGNNDFFVDALIIGTAVEAIFVLLIFWKKIESTIEIEKTRAIKLAQHHQHIDHLSSLLGRSRHELRSPLSDIVGLTELIADGPLDQRQRNFLGEIQHSARKGLVEINRMLSFQPSETTVPFSAPVTFNIENIIQECLDYYTLYVEQNNGEIILNTTHLNTAQFIGQPVLVQRLLISLLETVLPRYAIKELLIQLSSQSEDSVRIELIPQTMDTDDSINLLHDAQSDITKAIARQLRGRLSTSSSHNGLIVTLPLQQDAPGKIQASGDKNALRGYRVLIVDDNRTCCQVMGAYLNKMGIIAFEETSSVNALARLRLQSQLDKPIDIALIDYLMPDSNGIEVIQQVVHDATISARPKCMLMSNTPPEYDGNMLRTLGIDHLLEKPVLFSTLRSALLSLISQRDENFDKVGLTALIVEDNPITGKLLAAQLNDSTLQHELCNTAAQAEQACNNHDYDILFIDYNLPDGSLEELLPHLLTRQSASDPTVVAISADDSPELAARCYNAGADMFLAKPISMQDIERVIETQLQKKTS